MKKSALALILAVLMAVGLLTIGAAADEPDGSLNNPFTTVAQYNDAIKNGNLNGKDVYLTVTGIDFDADNPFNLTNVQSRENPPKLHLTITKCTFTGNTAKDTNNPSFMYLSNCQELVIDGCTFNAGDAGLKYGINWNLIQIEDAVVTITSCTFNGEYAENAIKLNQRNGEDDTATDIKPSNWTNKPIAASIKSAVIEGVTINSTVPVILLGSAAKGQGGAAAPSTGAFPVTISNVTTTSEYGVVVFEAYLADSKAEADAEAALVSGDISAVSGFVKVMEQGDTLTKTANGDLAKEDAFVAEVNGDKYTTLQAAIDAAGAGETVTVTMLADTEENVTIAADQNIILDLNGCTLDGGTTASKAALTNYGTVVIYDTSEDESGMIKRSDKGSPAYYTIQNEGVMTINSGNVWNDSGYSDKWSGSSLVCNGLRQAAELTINDGYFSQGNFIAVKNDENGKLTINGGTIVSNTQAVQNWCEAEIKGGTMTGTVSTWAYQGYDGETKISGGTIDGDVTSCWFSGGGNKVDEGIAPEVVITGGHITGELYKANATSVDDTYEVPDSTEGGSLAVKGGTFENPVSNLFVDSSLNYQAWDGTYYTYHETREEALEAAGANGIVSAVEGEGKVVYSVYYYTGTTGSEYRSESYIANDYATVISAPSKPGYIFMGWKCSDRHTHQPGEVIEVTKNLTFTAIWANMPDITPGTPGGDDDNEPVVPEFPFTDVYVGQWFYEAVKYVYSEGIMNGMDRYTFEPNGTLTRAMVWTMLARMDGADTEGGATWYSKAQDWAMSLDVSDGTDPMGNITREQLVTMLWRLNGSEAVTGSLTGFTDYDKISDWAGNAMLWATVEGIIEGDEANALNPTAGCTRAQAAAILMRYCENVDLSPTV